MPPFQRSAHTAIIHTKRDLFDGTESRTTCGDRTTYVQTGLARTLSFHLHQKQHLQNQQGHPRMNSPNGTPTLRESPRKSSSVGTLTPAVVQPSTKATQCLLETGTLLQNATTKWKHRHTTFLSRTNKTGTDAILHDEILSRID